MTWDQFTQALTAVIPIASFVAMVVSVLIFVKYKGTIDALNSAVETYRSLAEGYKEQVDQLKAKQDELVIEIQELKSLVSVQKEAMRIAIDEILEAFSRKGACRKADICHDFEADRRGNG